MEKLLFSFFVFFCVSVFAEQKKTMCQLGQDPADPHRLLDWDRECIIKSSAPQRVKMSTASGKVVECVLPPLTPVVVDRSSGKASWVFGCGNTILEPNWVPQGVRMCAPEIFLDKSQEVKQIQIPLSGEVKTEGKFSHQVDVSGEIRHIHSGEVIMRRQENIPAPQVPLSTSPTKKGWWQKNRKWVIPLAILGGVAAGYAASRGGQKSTVVYYQPLPPPIKR